MRKSIKSTRRKRDFLLSFFLSLMTTVRHNEERRGFLVDAGVYLPQEGPGWLPAPEEGMCEKMRPWGTIKLPGKDMCLFRENRSSWGNRGILMRSRFVCGSSHRPQDRRGRRPLRRWNLWEEARTASSQSCSAYAVAYSYPNFLMWEVWEAPAEPEEGKEASVSCVCSFFSQSKAKWLS